MLCHIVNEAKAWDPKAPSIALWLNRVRNIGAMEDFVLSALSTLKYGQIGINLYTQKKGRDCWGVLLGYEVSSPCVSPLAFISSGK